MYGLIVPRSDIDLLNIIDSNYVGDFQRKF